MLNYTRLQSSIRGGADAYTLRRWGGWCSGGTPGEITYLAWNRKVQHILASTSATGTTVVRAYPTKPNLQGKSLPGWS